MVGIIRFADDLSAWFGKAFAWLIVLMAFGTGWSVFSRYVLNHPPAWSLDVSFIGYGALFMMGGAYTLSRGGHVRGDFIYRLWQPRTQAKVDLFLYIIFFFPGVTALIFSGWKYASKSWGYGEVSINSPAGVPVYQFKMVMVAAGLLLFIQGIGQICRCLHCIRHNYWITANEDVFETEELLMKKAAEAETGGHV